MGEPVIRCSSFVVRNGLRTALFVAISVFFAASALALDRKAFTFTAYDLQMRVTTQAQAIDVRGKIMLRNDSDAAQTNAALQISSSLTWRAISVGGKAVVFESHPYTSDIDHTGALAEAIVSLPAAVPPHGTVTLDVSYGGTVTRDATRLTRLGLPEATARAIEWDEISPEFTGVRGIGYVTWYPVSIEAVSLSDGNAVAVALGEWKAREWDKPLAVKFTTDTDEAIRASLGCESLKANCGLSGFRLVVPTFVLGQFDQVTDEPLRVTFERGRRANADAFLKAAAAIRPLAEEWFGKATSVVDAIDFGNREIADFDNGDDFFTTLRTPSAENVAPIALARARFRWAPHLWVQHGAEQFLRLLWLERASGRAAAVSYLNQMNRAVGEAEIQARGAQPLDRATDPAMYQLKALFVWRMLRDMVGDEALKKALHAYQYQADTSSDYVQKVLQDAAGGRDLTWFFDDWVYNDRGLPDFHVETAYVAPLIAKAGQSAAGYTVTVTVANDGAAGAVVPVLVRTVSGVAQERVEVRAKAKGIVRITVPAEPVQVIVNDGSVPESNMTNNTYSLKK